MAKTPQQWADEIGLGESGILTCMGYRLDVKDLITKVQADQAADLQPFKSAYSRALDFVAVNHFEELPQQPTDDPFFASPIGNCCAVDILIDEIKQLNAAERQQPPTL